MTIQEKLQWAIEQWDLKNSTVIYERNSKAVYSSESVRWGKVILKANTDENELANEYQMLKEMINTSSCMVYAYDREHGVLIEERIIPGIILRKEENVALRVKHFLRLFRDIHKRIEDVHSFGTYLDWIKMADNFCMNNILDETIRNNINQACCIAEALFCKYDDRVLLHGDLHHDNMLLNEKGTYCMIDPKGVIGPEIFDLPRFILNEMDYVADQHYKEHVYQVVELISQKLSYPFTDIIKLFFMEVMLANVWTIEGGEEPYMHQILMAAELLNEVV